MIQQHIQAHLPHLYTGQIAFTETNGVTSYAPQNVTPKILTKQEVFSAQRNMMRNNYRQFVQYYANMCKEWNKEIDRYNSKVKHYINANELHEEADFNTQHFKNDIGKVSIQEYNAAAKITNDNLDKPLIELKKHVAIKKPTEAVFAMIIWVYSMQINQKNAILEGCGAVTTRAIQKVSINPHTLSNTVIDGVITLPYSKRTIQNHVSRLVDAGILFDSTFKGTNKPVEYHVNNSILAIFDHKTQKTLTAENQLFKYESEKELHHNDIVTRAIKDKRKITEIVENQFPLKDSLRSLFSQSFVPHDDKNIYKSTNPPIAKRNAPGAENFNKIDENSELLREMVQPDLNFVQDLSNDVFDNFRFTMRKHLERESMYGNMDKEEFRDLLLQIFFMMAAPIWKGKNVYMGAWFNAITIANDEFLINFNNSIPGKINALNMFDNLVWRLKWVKSFLQSHPDFRPLFPSDYFDPTRKTKASGGFAYTLEVLKKHQPAQDAIRKRKEKLQAAARVRNANEKALDLVKKKVKDLKNGKININQLHDYVTNNAHIPQELVMKLPLFIEKAYKC